MMLENGEKYPIRGDSYADYGFQIVGGTTKIGDEFTKAPAEFKEFALKKWTDSRISFSGLEGDHLKFVEFWEKFINAINENNKQEIKKISKAGNSFEEYSLTDIQKDVDKILIENVSFQNQKTAKLTSVLTLGTCYFTFELINGEWFLKDFNAAG